MTSRLSLTGLSRLEIKELIRLWVALTKTKVIMLFEQFTTYLITKVKLNHHKCFPISITSRLKILTTPKSTQFVREWNHNQLDTVNNHCNFIPREPNSWWWLTADLLSRIGRVSLGTNSQPNFPSFRPTGLASSFKLRKAAYWGKPNNLGIQSSTLYKTMKVEFPQEIWIWSRIGA